MKKLIVVIGLIVVAILVSGCDSDQDDPGNYDGNVIYCVGDKADDPNCVQPDATESPHGDDIVSIPDTDEDDVYVEPPVGCTKLEIIAGEWFRKTSSLPMYVDLEPISDGCRVSFSGEGSSMGGYIDGTNVPLQVSDGDGFAEVNIEDGLLIYRTMWQDQLCDETTYTRGINFTP